MPVIVILFKLTALYMTGLMVGGTIMGIFPVNEIFTLIVPIVMWFLGVFFEKFFSLSIPKFLNTKFKKTIIYVVLLVFGFLSVF